MSKLRLDPDALRVDTFRAEAPAARRALADPVSGEVSTDQFTSCLDSHGWTCGAGC